MHPVTRLLIAGLAMTLCASVAGAQQSVRVPNDSVAPRLTKQQLKEQQEAHAMKCLTAKALATREASGGEMVPSRAPQTTGARGALGLGNLDASQGLERPQHEPMFAGGGLGSNVRAAMAARNASATQATGLPCPAPPTKIAPPIK